jgi:hypothetical protein
MKLSDLEESAADELKKKLPSLSKTDYSTIDKLMRKISRRHHITAKKLHEIFVNKYGDTPDDWIKKQKEQLVGEELTPPGQFLSKADRLQQGDLIYYQGKLAGVATGKVQNNNVFFVPDTTDYSFGTQQYTASLPLDKVIVKNVDKKMHEAVNSNADLQKIKDFIQWSVKQLNVQKPYPKITLSKNSKQAQQGTHTGKHDGENIWVYIGDRNLIDIFRTIFHELVHHRQFQLDMIGDNDSYPGSPIEMVADVMAGKYIKIYGKEHPEIFQ